MLESQIYERTGVYPCRPRFGEPYRSTLDARVLGGHGVLAQIRARGAPRPPAPRLAGVARRGPPTWWELLEPAPLGGAHRPGGSHKRIPSRSTVVALVKRPPSTEGILCVGLLARKRPLAINLFKICSYTRKNGTSCTILRNLRNLLN